MRNRLLKDIDESIRLLSLIEEGNIDELTYGYSQLYKNEIIKCKDNILTRDLDVEMIGRIRHNVSIVMSMKPYIFNSIGGGMYNES